MAHKMNDPSLVMEDNHLAGFLAVEWVLKLVAPMVDGRLVDFQEIQMVLEFAIAATLYGETKPFANVLEM